LPDTRPPLEKGQGPGEEEGTAQATSAAAQTQPTPPNTPPQAPAATPAATSVEAFEVWGDYAKDRYDLQEGRRAEFRASARQLASVGAAVIGLELASVGRFLPTIQDPTWRVWSTVLFVAAVMLQSFFLIRAIRAGFGGEKHLGPESPVVLYEHVLGKEKAEVVRIVSAYYAKSADALHKMNETLISRIRSDALTFAYLLFAIVYIPAIVILLAPAHKETMPMTNQSEDGPSQPSSEPAPASPSDSSPATPLPSSPLDTPTPGQQDTAGARPPKIR
jgi:hypothetical protein